MMSLDSSFRIGSVEVENRLVLAPLAGVTDLLFRDICKRMGAGLVFTEMISDQGLIHSNRESFGIMDISEKERPVGIQIFGSDPDNMAQAARIVAEQKPDLIDINMGCPVPKVVKNGEGAALMLDSERAICIIRAVKRATGLPVSVKIRKGWDGGSVNAVEFALKCEAAGVSAISVHGRTRAEFYSGKADWEIIRQVKQAVGVPVIGNGDVWEPEDVFAMRRATGCDAVMVGRGSFGNPWIFARSLAMARGCAAPVPDLHERLELALAHLEATVKRRGEKIGIPYMRKHLAWYLKGVAGAAKVRQAINHAQTTAEVKALLGAHFGV